MEMSPLHVRQSTTVPFFSFVRARKELDSVLRLWQQPLKLVTNEAQSGQIKESWPKVGKPRKANHSCKILIDGYHSDYFQYVTELRL